MQRDLSADEVITLLGLTPHPEGGHFRETFRDDVQADERSASTAIYFLLKAGERSHWHAVDAAEGWHYHAGAPLLLELSPAGGPITAVRLGSDLAAGERPQAMVPKDFWQRARSL
ncbi:MAG: cupin domain-containing protein, partial [Hyphomicrobium denitrificans]|nr:cupin domain-containing protein [Hyphomicrobium denitrificans]